MVNRHHTNQKHSIRYEGESIRLDIFLKTLFEGVSRVYLQELIKGQKVTVNGNFAKKGAILHDQDLIEIDAFTHPQDRRLSAPNKPQLDIKFEHEHYLIIEKAAGLPTHPNEFSETNTVANHFIGLYPESLEVGEDSLRPGIVHRLDTNTSGLLILAKTQQGYDALKNLFMLRKIHKTYQALVLGVFPKTEKTIDWPIAHHPKNPRKMVALTDKNVRYRSQPREAQTKVAILTKYATSTLISVQTLTGRMHQVRVHLSAIGFPLIGDGIYQNQNEKRKDKFGLDRHFLHASRIEFIDPFSNEKVIQVSDLPNELKACLDQASQLSEPS